MSGYVDIISGLRTSLEVALLKRLFLKKPNTE
jgi:hypothetical protein